MIMQILAQNLLGMVSVRASARRPAVLLRTVIVTCPPPIP